MTHHLSGVWRAVTGHSRFVLPPCHVHGTVVVVENPILLPGLIGRRLVPKAAVVCVPVVRLLIIMRRMPSMGSVRWPQEPLQLGIRDPLRCGLSPERTSLCRQLGHTWSAFAMHLRVTCPDTHATITQAVANSTLCL